jgi:hypothetical protein
MSAYLLANGAFKSEEEEKIWTEEYLSVFMKLLT